MCTVKTANQIEVGEIVGLDFGVNVGLQWALVENVVENDDKIEVTVKMQKRFNHVLRTVKLEKDKRVNFQSFEKFEQWFKMYGLDCY